MSRLYYLIIFAFMSIAMSCHHFNNQLHSNNVIDPKWKKIPDNWIKRARQSEHKMSDTLLIKEFSALIQPDTLYNPHPQHIDSDENHIFTCISIDLDGDQKDELVCLQGWDIYSPYLCIFKQVDNNWYLVYSELIDTFYDLPTIYIANNSSKNKVFYLRRVYDHGSDVYIDGYSFYKLVDGQVYKCLDIINDAHIDGWGLYINQKVSSKFEFSGDAEDALGVTYTYNFYPGSINVRDCSWCSHEDISLISGEETVEYIYKDQSHKYELNIEKYDNSALNLTADKIACFADFGDDSLFVKAYKRQIDTTLKIGSPLKKKILRKYLLLADKNKTLRTEGLEATGQAGGTTFYGTKK